MKKGLRQAIAFLLVIAMVCSFALAGIQDEFPEGGRGKRGKRPAYNEGDLVVLFKKYELNMNAGTSTKLNGTVEGAQEGAAFYWKSSDEDVVRVTGTGVSGSLEAVGEGKAKIKLTVINPDNTYDYDIAMITVKGSDPVKVSGGGKISLDAGTETKISARISGSNAPM